MWFGLEIKKSNQDKLYLAIHEKYASVFYLLKEIQPF